MCVWVVCEVCKCVHMCEFGCTQACVCVEVRGHSEVLAFTSHFI